MTTSPTLQVVCLAVAVKLCLAGCARQPAAPPPSSTSPAAPAAADAITEVDPKAASGDAAPPARPAMVEPGSAESQSVATQQRQPAAAFYAVGSYDESRDPAADLAATIQRATAENKRILIQVGGEWCIWCQRISQYMEANAAVRHLVDEHFVVMKVTYPSDNSEEFLQQFPQVSAYPHLFVLAPDGAFLHSQGTAVLEAGSSYDEEVFCRFLNEWKL